MFEKAKRQIDSLGARLGRVKRGALLVALALGSATPGTASADTVSSSQLSRVIDSYRPVVRRTCWRPALESKGSEGAVSARVQLDIVVGPSGSVDMITATGAEQSFPGLSTCIASALRRSQFPASGATTPVKAVFMFLEQ